MAEQTPPPAASSPPPGLVIPQQATRSGRIAARLVFALVRTVDATVRYRWEADPSAESASTAGPVIFAVWHNRLALSLMIYRRYFQSRRPSRRMAALVSASRDGGLLARVLELFGVQPVRGSSSRRGPQAMLELTSWAERGYDLAITPDGPRGPACVVQEGVVAAARLTGLPILPVSCHLQWKYRAPSWDRFQVPLPFTRCTVRFGAPVYVPREAGEAERQAARQQVARYLDSPSVD